MHHSRSPKARWLSTCFTSFLGPALLASGLAPACASRAPCPCATETAATAAAPVPEAAETPAPRETRRQNDDVPAAHKRGGKKLIAQVGSAGGTLELDNGARLEIPEGALAESAEVTFAEGAKTTAFSNHDYEQAIGATLEIAPELPLSAPVRVSIPAARLPEGFDESHLTLGLEVMASAQRGVPMQGTQTRWDYLPAKSEHGRAVAELTHVPGFRLQFLVSKSD